jgi:hypothetical protein
MVFTCVPPLHFFWGVFLFCAINLSLEIFKKCSYDLFDFFLNLGFSIFVFLNLFWGLKLWVLWFFWRNCVTRLIFEQTLFLGVSSFVFSTWFWGFQSWFFEFFKKEGTRLQKLRNQWSNSFFFVFFELIHAVKSARRICQWLYKFPRP